MPANTRLEAFSDGVFAIAVTLLGLDLRVPELERATPAALGQALLRGWPGYAAFLVSFVTLLIGWGWSAGADRLNQPPCTVKPGRAPQAHNP